MNRASGESERREEPYLLHGRYLLERWASNFFPTFSLKHERKYNTVNSMTITQKIPLLLVLTLIGASILIMPAYGTTEPAYSTTVGSESSIDMSVVNMRTTTSAGFVVSESTPVELTYNIRVTDLDGIPSHGKVSTFMEGIIHEGRKSALAPFETIEFNERTSIDGHIYLFDKDMRYSSGRAR